MLQNLQPKVAIVILNYNTKPLLARFLPAVEATSYQNKEIWVVDNASKDGSAKFVYDNFQDINLLETQENLGYAGGYNWALNQIEADYFVLLNSDVLVTPSWINSLVALALSNPNIAAIQPKILDFKNKELFEYAGASGGFLDKWGYAFCRGRIFDVLEKDSGQYNTVEQVFWATGACLFVDAKAYQESGGLDADFFAHMEEIDLCWRLQKMGKLIYVQPQSEVYHIGGGTLTEGSDRKYFLNFRNNLVMMVKNHTGLWLPVLLWRMVLDGVSAIKFVLDGKPSIFVQLIKSHLAFWGSLKSTLTKRKEIKAKWKSKVMLYPKSIVWQHFAKKVKHYSQLETS